MRLTLVGAALALILSGAYRVQKEYPMTKAILTHDVVDVERWLEGKEERAAIIGRYATNIQDYAPQDGSNRIAISCDFHDLEGMTAMMASPSAEDAATMEQHGVRPPFMIYLER